MADLTNDSFERIRIEDAVGNATFADPQPAVLSRAPAEAEQTRIGVPDWAIPDVDLMLAAEALRWIEEGWPL